MKKTPWVENNNMPIDYRPLRGWKYSGKSKNFHVDKIEKSVIMETNLFN
jgi:hypothetical protein